MCAWEVEQILKRLIIIILSNILFGNISSADSIIPYVYSCKIKNFYKINDHDGIKQHKLNQNFSWISNGVEVFFTKNIFIKKPLYVESVKDNVLSARSVMVLDKDNETYNLYSNKKTTQTLMKFNLLTKALSLTNHSSSELNIVLATCK